MLSSSLLLRGRFRMCSVRTDFRGEYEQQSDDADCIDSRAGRVTNIKNCGSGEHCYGEQSVEQQVETNSEEAYETQLIVGQHAVKDNNATECHKCHACRSDQPEIEGKPDDNNPHDIVSQSVQRCRDETHLGAFPCVDRAKNTLLCIWFLCLLRYRDRSEPVATETLSQSRSCRRTQESGTTNTTAL